jgi:hypothetical protein
MTIKHADPQTPIPGAEHQHPGNQASYTLANCPVCGPMTRRQRACAAATLYGALRTIGREYTADNEPPGLAAEIARVAADIEHDAEWTR